MAIQRVYVIWTNPLFCESVRLLLQHPMVEWAGDTSDHARARSELMTLRPDTIIIECGESAPREEVTGDILDLLQADLPHRRIICLSLDDNELKVYHRERRTLGAAGDLVQLILD